MSIARPHFTRSAWFVPLLLSIFYFASHLFALTSLPVFADEAIYIHWAQLILSDWQRYLFFPLNDGKTPLFIWLMVPFEAVIKDPLWAGRAASVLVGFGQMWLSAYLVKILGGRSKAQWVAMLLTATLPFWFFYQRQALIDTLLVFCVSLVMIATIQILNFAQLKTYASYKAALLKDWFWILILGLSFWAALFTKLPAVLIVPVIGIWLLGFRLSRPQRMQAALHLAIGLGIGTLLFGLLGFVPGAGQIFHRGSDFLFPWRDVVFGGRWRDTLPNIPSYLNYFWIYTHPFILLGVVASLFTRKKKRTFHLLFWSMIIFALPMAILGKVVYARYFLPLMIWLTASSALVVQQLYAEVLVKAKINVRFIVSVVLALLLANVLATAGAFMYVAWFQPNQLPLASSDINQYLTMWSSGHGIVETESFLRQQAATQRVAVATEGFFGTLPDGLSIYFYSQPDPHVSIDGIGEPVTAIPDFFRQSSAAATKKYLVVNSDRMKLALPASDLVNQYCRPYNAPCLQVWDITQYLQKQS